MAYDKPDSNVANFNFTKKGYVPPQGNQANFKFFKLELANLSSLMGAHQPKHLSAGIISSYCQTLSPKKYIVGYENGIPQFITTRQKFRCVNFLSAQLRSVFGATKDLFTYITPTISTYKDLKTSIIAGKTIYSSYKSLNVFIVGLGSSFRNLSSSIIGSYCQTLSPKKYIVGYENGIPQFITTRQKFRCVNFLSASIAQIYFADLFVFIEVIPIQHGVGDLSAFIEGISIQHGISDLLTIIRVWGKDQKDLSAGIGGHYPANISVFIRGWSRENYKNLLFKIHGWAVKDLTANIDIHFPVDLLTYLNVVLRDARDLSIYIRGWVISDLHVIIRAMRSSVLSATLNSVLGVDLFAYLKVWPQRDLLINLYGWAEKDLSANIGWNIKKDLPCSIGIHLWKNLSARLKGWVREVMADLPGFVRGLAYEELQATIRATYLTNLSAYLFSIRPKDLSSYIYGWDTKDLTACLIGGYGPNDLRVFINAGGGFRGLSTYIKGVMRMGVASDLKTIISSWYSKNLSSIINVVGAVNLSVYLNSLGYSSDLLVFIYPKMIHLTTIISIATMEHLDLSATINLRCRLAGSAYKELSSRIRCMYLANLLVSLVGKKYPKYSFDLAVSIGYAPGYIVIDKLPINVSIGSGYIVEDKLPIYIRIYKQLAMLSASVVGTLQYKNLFASLTPVYLSHYEFDNIKKTETVIHRDRSGSLDWYKVVELSFQSIVNEYFYVEGGGGKLYKTDKTQRWRTDIKSYVPEDVESNIRRRLFRVRTIYDLTKFSSIDAAVKFVIDYVTRINYSDLSSFIAASGGFLNLPVSIKPKYFTTTDLDLSSTITADERTFVIGFSDDGVSIL